jgi:hypothetical protein
MQNNEKEHPRKPHEGHEEELPEGKDGFFSPYNNRLVITPREKR